VLPHSVDDIIIFIDNVIDITRLLEQL